MDLNLLDYIAELKISTHPSSKQIWDKCRKKWVTFTPEEMVRQLFIMHLTERLGYSANRIGVEKEVKLEKTKKRFDLIIYLSDLTPYMLIECKAPEIKLNESVIAQVVRYNRVMLAGYLGVVNGLECRLFKSNQSTWTEIFEFPPTAP